MRALIICLLISLSLAKELQIKPGESKIFNTKSPITAVFASDPKVFDYKIVNQTTIAVYGKSDGYGEILIFGGDDVLLNLQAKVDAEALNLQSIARMIEKEYPNSSIEIQKLTATTKDFQGQKGYSISGIVPNEEIKEKAYLMAATALGLTIKRDKIIKQSTEVTSTQGVSIGRNSSGQENLDFLERKSVDGLVDNLKTNTTNQVNVQLIVADVEKSIVEKLGIDYNNGNFIIPITTPQVHSFSRLLKGVNITAVVDAIKDDNLAKILATPNISVLSGESASFQVTSQYTPISTTLNNAGFSVSSPQTPVDYGVSLTVQPKVFSKDRIVMNVSQEVSNIQSLVEGNGASAANLKKRRTSSVISLADGDSFILGGLIDEREAEQVKSIPLLGDVPILGAAFRKSNLVRSKTELIVIATVTLTKPKQSIPQIPTFQGRSIVGSLLNLPYAGISKDEELQNFTSNLDFIK